MMRTQCILVTNRVFKVSKSSQIKIDKWSPHKSLQIDTRKSKNQNQKMLHFQALRKTRILVMMIKMVYKIFEKYYSFCLLNKKQMILELFYLMLKKEFCLQF